MTGLWLARAGLWLAKESLWLAMKDHGGLLAGRGEPAVGHGWPLVGHGRDLAIMLLLPHTPHISANTTSSAVSSEKDRAGRRHKAKGAKKGAAR